MKHVYLDTSSHINLSKEEHKEKLKFFKELIEKKKVEVLISHAVYDEIKQDIIIPTVKVPVGSSVYDYSRLGQKRLGDPDGVYNKITKDIREDKFCSKEKRRKWIWDGIHYSTAHFENVDIFIFKDKKLKNRIEEKIPNHVKLLSIVDDFEEIKKILLS